MRHVAALGLLSATLALGSSWGQTRPNEEEMFGGSSTPDAGTPAPKAPAESPSPNSETTRTGEPGAPTAAPGAAATEDARLTAPSAQNAFEAGRVRDNPLQIGGLFYIRAYANAYQDTPASRTPISMPLLLDAFMDSRPTDRLRAMVDARLSFDPFLQTSFQGIPSTAPPPANPSVGLDQAWLSFDIERVVFMTVGRQHVKWGTGHFFSPCDFLSSQRRDPLAVYDTRLGVSMVRAVVPWESAGWSFTGVALFEPTQQAYTSGVAGSSGSTGVGALSTAASSQTSLSSPTNYLENVGGALRAEATFGNTVVGIDGLAQKNRKPRLGLDLSFPVSELDVYGEGLIISGSDYDLVTKRAVPDFTQPSLGQVFYTTGPNNPGHITPGVVAGVTWNRPVLDNKSIAATAEYFYNGAGYSNANVYPGLILNGLFQPFYTGQHYLALNASLSDTPHKTTYILSNIGNLTDGSYIARFDFNVILLSYLTVEAFGDYHYGHSGGELKFSFNASEISGVPLPPTVVVPVIPAPTFDIGVGLRMAM
jgi:hypothetical protein